MSEEGKATATARRRYDRVSPVYDIMEGLAEGLRFSGWRRMMWSMAEGSHILEVGVGTGKNLHHYPGDAEITAIDFSEGMLTRAKAKAKRQDVSVRLHQMDVQNLEFGDDTFDSVVDTFVFCSVPDPLRGLTEVRRVCKPGGKVLMLEHELSASRVLAGIMRLANPLVVRAMGANINRRTVENVARSGLTVERVTDLFLGVFKLIEARKGT
jgi:ubiquinone/menaquinone biosynthesis C-methylase UbiE